MGASRRAWWIVVPCVVGALLAVALGVPAADARTPRHALPPGSRGHDLGPSPVVFPPQHIPIRMTHDQHVKELGLHCTECHEAVPQSRSAADNLLPSGERCDQCHGTDHRNLDHVTAPGSSAPGSSAQRDSAPGKCETCHIGYQPASLGGDAALSDNPQVERLDRVVLPQPHVRFSHAAHLQRNIGCGHCHGAVQELSQATREQMPRMRGCLKCHGMPGPSRGDANGECRTCHLTRGGVLKTRFDSGVLVPPAWLGAANHGPQWLERHKVVAGQDSRLCASCHQEKECVDCHDGRVRPRPIHPNDWLSQHGTAASMASQRCTSCHRQQSFCLSCHANLGVAESAALSPAAKRGRYHPPPAVWTDGPRGRGHHGWEAQRNLDVCVGCHVERDCLDCHATAGRGGSGIGGVGRGTNPHPMGFRNRCESAYRRNPRPCLVCHEPSDSSLRRCR